MFFDHLGVRPPSPEIRFCRWGFACTRSFCSRKELLQHNLAEHVPTAVPVYRHELPMLLRTAEGIGESYETEHFLSSVPRSAKGEGSSQGGKNYSQDSGPAASLPSPPVSLSSRPGGRADDEYSILSGSESPRSQAQEPSPMFYEDLDHRDFMAQSTNILLSDALEPPSPGFASLDASTGSPRPGSIPPSPSFSDILASSTQKGLAKPHSPIPSRFLAHTLSCDSSSSSNSCAIVEEQLTPNDDFSFDEDRDGLSQSLPVAAEEFDHSDLSQGVHELGASQMFFTQQPTESESQISPQTRRPFLHVRGVQNTTLSSSTSSQLPPPEVAGPTRKQSWYGPTTRPRKRSRGSNLSPSVSPVNTPAASPHGVTAFAVSSSASRSRRTRGILDQATPHRIRDDPSHSGLHRKRYNLNSTDPDDANSSLPKIRYNMTAQHSSHDADCDADVSQMQPETQLTMSPAIQEPSYGMYDYAIQTQAPYDSQS
ncbi:hypothetical protein C8J55DRAFT_512478 [Lentinula edodes]|uniref:Uncharacterized protein n=1 Tax=Lentinula lateritia TaxID=40482 RepID=A0A9W9AG31_9AGAR|nr:hypothetical protein C8J55DRAFT_512478 [Lentinula edodes]